MAHTYERVCIRCATKFEAKRSNAKRCPICRLHNDLVHAGSKTKPCVNCGEKFGFINKDEKLCPDCDRRIPHMTRATCGVCKSPNSPCPIANLRVCVECIHDTRGRDEVLYALLRRIQYDANKNGVTA